MRFGVLTDLHLGHHGEGRWHNRLLFDHAEEITRAAVGVLNDQALDATFALGDLTQDGWPDQLALARDVLSGLNAPWYVLPGNHDSALVRAGLFDRVFSGHLVLPYSRLGDLGVAGIREQVSSGPYQEPLYQVDQAWAGRAEVDVRQDCPGTLLVLSHFPLLDEHLRADRHGGKDAGRFRHGEVQVRRLLDAWHASCATRGYKAVLLCGHEHWHHVSVSHDWVQCVTASLIEFPMEVRVVELSGNTLRIDTLAVPVGDLPAQSLATDGTQVTWVRGDEADRSVQLTIEPTSEHG